MRTTLASMSRLFSRGSAARYRQAVVPPTGVVEIGRGPLLGLLDETLREEALDRGVECSRSQTKPGVPLLDLEKDSVTVAVLVREGDQDLEHGEG